MSEVLKPIVSKEETLDRLEIRLGKILSVNLVKDTAKPAYVMKADFGKFGVRISVGRFAHHSPDELENALILGVLNLGTKTIGAYESEFLCLGVQFPKAESGEATIVSPVAHAKIGGKLF